MCAEAQTLPSATAGMHVPVRQQNAVEIPSGSIASEVRDINGLPVLTLYFENDDDAQRKLGKDSRLTFVAPADGTYFIRITDVRGFSG